MTVFDVLDGARTDTHSLSQLMLAQVVSLAPLPPLAAIVAAGIADDVFASHDIFLGLATVNLDFLRRIFPSGTMPQI